MRLLNGLEDNHDNSQCVRWVDKAQGVFQLVDPEVVALLWGACKKKPDMNYEKMSRSLRYYYARGIIAKVSNGQRCVYRFVEIPQDSSRSTEDVIYIGSVENT